MKKTILQLCADTGSDTWPYRQDPAYEVITIGADIGVENYSPDRPIHGIIANPVCTNFSRVRRGKPGQNYPHVSDPEAGMFLVRECQRIIEEAQPKWWAIENPATGTLRNYLGKPDLTYQPWQYGSPWTKLTGLWGNFTPPPLSTIRGTTCRASWTCGRGPAASRPSSICTRVHSTRSLSSVTPGCPSRQPTRSCARSARRVSLEHLRR